MSPNKVDSLDNELMPAWHQAIIWTKDDFSSLTPQGTDKIIETNHVLLTNLHFKLSSVILQPLCPGGDNICKMLYL